ncbi:GerW family sporulation protein [Tyzzerella sp. OttesenSCG-928-J15]|nr:GerW family sporulation protein [Tyzzerella sp. OttesenSCG-928-J15]
MENNFNSNLETLFGSLDSFISTKTVVGEPIHIGDVIMLPLVDVLFGVGAAATNSAEKSPKEQDAGGLGAKITPSAVIVIKNNTVQLVNVKNQDALSKLIDMAPGILSKLNLSTGGSSSNGKETVKKETVTETETIVTEPTE